MNADQLHILLVDDESLFTNVIGTALAKESCRISTINAATQVLPFIERDRPDLIMLDIMMPSLSGYDLCRAIREKPECQDMYILFATARTGQEDLLKGFECGANDYITKPFRIPEVQARVRAGLRVCSLQRELRLKNRELERVMEENALIIGTAVHDVRSPLSIIINYLSLLGDEDIMPADKIKEVCLQRAYHIVNVVDDFLNLTRLNTGKITCMREPVDIVPIAASCAIECVPMAKKKGVELTYSMPQEELEIMVDPERLQTIVSNLVSNAVKFTPAGGRVSVNITHDAGRATVTVTDTGIGIKSDHMARIFEPFPRIAAGRKQDFDSTHTGMGLAIAHRLTDRMGGTLRAESDGEGKGSRFILSFPHAAAHE